MDNAREQYRFQGFEEPNYTQIPDVFFDEVMCHLTEAELRVALYIMRRTFGFKKRADAISFNQFLKGITTRDGRRLDHGCGIAGRTNLTRALKGLEDKGVITACRSISAKGDAQTTVYELCFKDGRVVPQRDHPSRTVVTRQDHPSRRVVTRRDHPGDRPSPPVVIERDLQQTALQKTANNNTEISKPNDATKLDIVIDAISAALHDTRHNVANRARAARILGGVSEEHGVQIAERTLDRVQTIIRTQGGVKNQMAYYFGVLEDMARPSQELPAGRGSLAGRYAHLVER